MNTSVVYVVLLMICFVLGFLAPDPAVSNAAFAMSVGMMIGYNCGSHSPKE